MLEYFMTNARILIVDDQDGNTRLLERILASAGYTHCRSLTDPREVVSVCQEWSPDLILLDLMMPHLDGFEVMKQLRDLLPPDTYLPILALTADVNPQTRQRALSEGAKDFLNKPFDQTEVLQRIANLLETRFLHLKVQEHSHSLENTVRERTQEVREQATLIAKASDAIMVCDLQDCITFWNEGAQRLYGWSRAEAIGKNANELLRGRSHQSEEALNATRLQGEWAGEIPKFTKNNKEVIVMSRWTLMLDDAGNPKSILAIDTDITKKRSMEAQLLHAQRMEGIGMVTGKVAHDFNNLLTIISGFTEMAINRMQPDDPLRGMLQQVFKAGERAATLTHHLACSRKQVFQIQVLDLNSLVVDVVKMLSRLIGEGVQIDIVSPPALGHVKADASQIEQILLNLCINARDAMPAGGRITIVTQNVEFDEAYVREHPYVKPGRHVSLAVRDTGTGMDDATKARMFEPFFTTKEIGKGTGLGLPTVYGIVKQSGGSIEFDSELGRGTTFYIYLPRVDEPLSASKSLHDIAPTGTETILLVDDDADVRSLSRLALQSFGYRVLDAESGAGALALSKARQAPIDLLITDVIMPGMSGRELADRLVAERLGLKVLYVSGYNDDAIVRDCVAAGGASFLAKPITPGVLARTVRMVLDA